MRYAVISKGLTISQLQSEVQRYGGRNLKIASISKQIFCDLDDAGLLKIKTIPGLTVKGIGRISHQQISTSPLVIPAANVVPTTYGTSQASFASGFYDFRHSFNPHVLGDGCTIAILDSGIRKTHEGLRDKVVYEANFSDSPTCDDIFDHGTGVAYVAAGGIDQPGTECGMAPNAYLWNIKVLDDNGEGTEENAVLGIEHCMEKEIEGDRLGLAITDPMELNLLNISWGGPDDGDPDNPIRVALRAFTVNPPTPTEAIIAYPIAAAGNQGPNPGTITFPACDERVIAVGAATFSPFAIWEYSSRGPTKEGLIKPDVAGYGVRMLTASSKADDAYVVKSGTSFSAPAVSGAFALLWQAYRRVYGTEEPYVGIEQWHQITPTLCVKPEGIAMGKDNDYGYGTLSGLAALQLGRTAMPLAGIMEGIIPIVGIGMLGVMMASAVKGEE